MATYVGLVALLKNKAWGENDDHECFLSAGDMRQAATAIETLVAELAKAREGLEKAQLQFRFYADEHDAKAKEAKTNHDFATMLAETLAEIGEVDGGNNSG